VSETKKFSKCPCNDKGKLLKEQIEEKQYKNMIASKVMDIPYCSDLII